MNCYACAGWPGSWTIRRLHRCPALVYACQTCLRTAIFLFFVAQVAVGRNLGANDQQLKELKLKQSLCWVGYSSFIIYIVTVNSFPFRVRLFLPRGHHEQHLSFGLPAAVGAKDVFHGLLPPRVYRNYLVPIREAFGGERDGLKRSAA